MWALLSTRLRTWLLFAVAVPVTRSVLRRAADRARQNDPDGRSARVLSRVATTMAKLDRRRR